VQQLPCFLCGRQLGRRIDKNGKPYFVCDPCGTQIFIRRKPGIENLDELIRTLRGRDLPFREHARVLFKIQAVLAEIRGVKKEIKTLDRELGLFSRRKDKVLRTRTRKLLHARIETLLSQLKEIAHEDAHI
jgi:DNA-directed RNA polymerase subunit RPC12/RpoP